MKETLVVMLLVGFILVASGGAVWAGEIDILLKKLVEKNVLTQHEAQTILDETKQEMTKEVSEGKAVTAPEWTQKIHVKGDVRFRTQADFADNVDNSAGYALRQRVRARIGIEGKVNEEVSAGVRIVTGSVDARSTNETLSDDGIFAHSPVRFDQYYIRWQPGLPDGVGDVSLWGGKFSNPMNKTELLWDGDITPDGMALQYMSPTFELGRVPTNLYSNVGYFWLSDDSGGRQWTKGNPMLAAVQGGLKMDIIKDWDSKLDLAAAYYDVANVQHEARDITLGQATDGAFTNTYTNTEWRYDFNMIDFIVKYDSKKFFDFEMGHGIFADIIGNVDPSDYAYMIGAYLGDKKVKKPGQWKVWGNWRRLERDAVPDFLPDSDFFGWIRETGGYAGGGTNAEGWNGGIQYGFLKNTVLSLEYYYMEPIKTDPGVAGDVEPYQLIQTDIVVKF